MFERLGAGIMARLVRDSADGPARAEDYEAVLAPIYAWIHAVAQNRTTGATRGTDGASSRAWSSALREAVGAAAPGASAAAALGARVAFPAAWS